MKHKFIRNGKTADLKVKVISNKQTGELIVCLGEDASIKLNLRGTLRLNGPNGFSSSGFELNDSLFTDTISSEEEEVLE